MWMERMRELFDLPPGPMEDKIFSPKNPEIPRLQDYEKKAPAWYWDIFPRNEAKSAKSKIDPDKLRELALECGYSDRKNLDKIIGWIREGAKIGCHGKYRAPTMAKNSKSCVADGYKISDAIGSWIKKG